MRGGTLAKLVRNNTLVAEFRLDSMRDGVAEIAPNLLKALVEHRSGHTVEVDDVLLNGPLWLRGFRYCSYAWTGEKWRMPRQEEEVINE